MTYNIIGYEEYDGSRKVYLQIEASSKEEALRLAKEGQATEMDAKDFGGENYKPVDLDDWKVEDR